MENVNFDQFRGDVEGIKVLIHKIKTMKWLGGDGKLPDRCLLFGTLEEASNAARDAARDAAQDAVQITTRFAAQNAARETAQDADRIGAWSAARAAVNDATWATAWFVAGASAGDAARDAMLYAGILTCDGLHLAKECIDYAQLLWSVWEAGYGVASTVTNKNGEVTVYCYLEI